MIKVTVYEKGKHTVGYEISGHAGYADVGQDIVCAAVSVLGINTINALDTLTDATIYYESHDDGYLKLEPQLEYSGEAQVLIDSFVLGIQQIYENYGHEYIHIEYKEV